MRTIESWAVPYLVNSLWQVPLLFAAGWLAARMLRRLGPAAEHRIWVAVLLLQALLPACSAVSLDWLPSLGFRTAHSSGEGGVSVVMGPALASGGIHLSGFALALVAVVYCAVTAWFAARFFWRLLQLRALRNESVEAVLSDQTRDLWTASLRAFHCSRVSLAASSRVVSPVTMGLAQPLVLLPAASLAAMAPAEFHAIAAHELAHIRRGDFLRNLLYELLALPVSYHPLLWLTREQLAQTREMVCDQLAAEIAGPKQYARSLLRLASVLITGAPIRTPHTIGIFDTNTLERRLMNWTERRPDLRGLRRTVSLAACLALGAGVCASALALRINVNALPQASEHPPAHPNAPVAVKWEVMASQRIGGPMPVYPPEAKKARIQGTVLIDVVISKDGSVLSPEVTSGPKELRESALDAVRQWKYKPFLLNGEPVEVKTTIHVVYSLKK